MDNRQDNTQEPITVPYVVFRDDQTHHRWVVSRLIWALIIVTFLVFASNIAWLIAWNQYTFLGDEITTTVDSEGDGIANYTGGNGGVINIGESDSPQTDEEHG